MSAVSLRTMVCRGTAEQSVGGRYWAGSELLFRRGLTGLGDLGAERARSAAVGRLTLVETLPFSGFELRAAGALPRLSSEVVAEAAQGKDPTDAVDQGAVGERSEK